MFIGIAATVLSMLMGNVPEFAGIWQRIIFIAAFAWLIYLFEIRSQRTSENAAEPNK